MQNRYVGDIGDYGKYGLLREIEKSGFHIGINWYYTPDENHNADGKHTTYTHKEKEYRKYDAQLFDIMQEIVNNEKRSLKAIENSNIFTKANYYSEVLDMKSDTMNARLRERASWHWDAMLALKDCPIVFLDPDNGLQVKSVSPTSMKGNKYVAFKELIDYYASGQSIILYQHRGRESDISCLRKLYDFKMNTIPDATTFSLRYTKGTIRHYVFFVQPEFAEHIKNICINVASNKWKDFCEYFDMEEI